MDMWVLKVGEMTVRGRERGIEREESGEKGGQWSTFAMKATERTVWEEERDEWKGGMWATVGIHH